MPKTLLKHTTNEKLGDLEGLIIFLYFPWDKYILITPLGIHLFSKSHVMKKGVIFPPLLTAMTKLREIHEINFYILIESQKKYYDT